MFKLDLKKQVVYYISNSKKTGSSRITTYKINLDKGGWYGIPTRHKSKVYLTPENCINLFDTLDSVKYN